MTSTVNNGFGELPRERGNHHMVGGAVLSGTVILMAAYQRYTTSSPMISYDDAGLICAAISAVLLGRYGIRTLLLFAEEKSHVNARYSQSLEKAFKSCMTFSGRESLYVAVFGFCVALAYWKESENVLLHWQAYILVALVTGIYPPYLSRAELSQVNETENKHVADGLAWSYYFGYLKLLLPGFDGMIADAVKPRFQIDGENIRNIISCTKLLIVIPKDCYCYDTFSDIDKRIQYKTSMPEIRKTRGGVQERVYKNTLYEVQVTPNGKPLYVMMEYATPVLSMYDMCKHTKANFTEEDLSSQVQEFCKKLKEILDNDPNCVGKYELVLTKAAHENLADIINDTVKSVTMSF